MPAPRQCTLPTPCDRGYGPMRGCGLCRGNVHGGVVHARGGVALWRGWGIPLKGAALGSCQTRPSGDIRLPAPKKTTMELGLPEKNWRWTRTVVSVSPMHHERVFSQLIRWSVASQNLASRLFLKHHAGP